MTVLLAGASIGIAIATMVDAWLGRHSWAIAWNDFFLIVAIWAGAGGGFLVTKLWRTFILPRAIKTLLMRVTR